MKPSERAQRLIAELMLETRDLVNAQRSTGRGRDTRIDAANKRLGVVKDALSDYVASLEQAK